MVVGQHIQRRLGLASRLQDPLHRRQGEGAEPHGALQSRENVLAAIGGTQRQNPLCLALAIASAGQQALQEATARWAELGKSRG